MFVIGEIAGVALITLAAGCGKVGGATDPGCVGRVMAGKTTKSAMHLIRCGADKWRSSSDVTAQAVLGRRRLILIDENT